MHGGEWRICRIYPRWGGRTMTDEDNGGYEKELSEAVERLATEQDPKEAEEEEPKPKRRSPLDGFADETAIAAKDIGVELVGTVLGAAREWTLFTADPEHYLNKKRTAFATFKKRLRRGAKKTAQSVGDGAKDLVSGAKETVVGAQRRVTDSAKELGYNLKEKGLGGVASELVTSTGEGLEKTVASVSESQLATPDDLYVSGIENIIGRYLPEQVRKSAAVEVRTFVAALQSDTDAFPLDLNIGKGGKRNELTRKKLLEDFVGYSTTKVDELLYHLKLRRGDFTSDPDPTLTRNEILVLEGPVGGRIAAVRDAYIRGKP